MARQNQTLKEKIFKKALPEPNSGCWLWGAHCLPNGYGRIRVGDKIMLAHRVSYEAYIGPVGDKNVCHKCDQRSCVNPEHLYLGTQSQNIRDCVKKGRGFVGEKNGNAKLTNSDIIEIRKSTGTHREIAKRFGVDKGNIGLIKSGKAWKHVAQ